MHALFRRKEGESRPTGISPNKASGGNDFPRTLSINGLKQ